MAFYKQDIVDVNLETGVIHRSFLNHTIGHKDDDADRFGIRAFRNGEPVDLIGAQCQAVFMAPDGTNIALTSYGTVSGNEAYVTLPQACYNVEGQFCLAIKLVGGGVTATVRIIDGVVDRTGATGAVAPTEAVPTYQEILAVYADMQEDVADYESVVATQNGKIDDLKSALVKTQINSDNIFTLINAVLGIINSSGEVISSSTYPTVRTTDFIPVEASTKYYVVKMDENAYGQYTPLVVGYYNSSKTFISRETNVNVFTTPATASYIRITENVSTPFTSKLVVSKYGYIFYKQDKIYSDYAVDDTVLKDLIINTGNLRKFIDNLKLPLLIGSNGKWTIISSSPLVYGSHVLIPVNEGDLITLTASVRSGVYAFLKDKKCLNGELASFTYKYNIIQHENEAPEFVVVTDGSGNPVVDTRHELMRNETVSIIAVPETAYLYLTLTSYVDGNEYDMMPDININGKIISRNETIGIISDEGYETVFFDDFDSFNSDAWEMITENPPVDGKYNSRFYTTSENAYVEQSCMVLKCHKDNTIEKGTHLDYQGESQQNEYLASYISTGKSYAIPYGRISARMKFSSIGHNSFPGGFWTFGQDEAWSYAHEMDIFEIIQDYISAQTIKGVHYNNGSVQTIIKSHLHSTNSSGTDVDSAKWPYISYANRNGSTIENDNVVYDYKNLDPTEWHIYTVDWDEKQIRIYIDEKLYTTFDASKIGAVDRSGNVGFFYPQDIRFNIKAYATNADDGYLFIDWVKAEVKNKTPCTLISHSDISMTVGQEVYVNPTFNSGCSNKAFSMETESEGIIKINKTPAGSTNIINSITGVGAGTATVKLVAANGRTESTFTVEVG